MPDDKQWSRYQSAIFDDVASGTGHTCVNARAGSGKTTTVLEALRHVPQGKGAFFCAFNRAIADELLTRVPKGMLGEPRAEVSTLHSYGLRAVTRAMGRLKFENYCVEARAKMLPDVGDTREKRELRTALAKAVSISKATLSRTAAEIDAALDEYELDTCPEHLDRPIFLQHVQTLLSQSRETADGLIDFDDMVWLPVERNLSVWKYDRVFVDETQDLNACQIKLVMGAVKASGRICAVGDPRQAIYRFRGAASGAFERVRDSLKAKELPLSVTYRCAKSIVALANEIVPDLEAAPGAPDGIVRDAWLNECRKLAAPGDFILSRTNAPLVGLCLGFLREGRRAHIQGRDVGATLAAFVRKSGAVSVEAFRHYVMGWHDAEVRRLAAKGRDVRPVDDKASTLMALSDGASTMSEIVSRIESLFVDNDDGARIVLSTTHKTKGLERDRVWMLADTYRRRPGVEEENLYYVCCTRARLELIKVHAKGSDGSYDDPGVA